MGSVLVEKSRVYSAHCEREAENTEKYKNLLRLVKQMTHFNVYVEL